MTQNISGCRPLNTANVQPADMVTSRLTVADNSENTTKNDKVAMDSLRSAAWAFGAEVKQVKISLRQMQLDQWSKHGKIS